MRISEALRESCCIVDLKGATKKEIIEELTGALHNAGLIRDASLATKVVLERETLGSTGVGDGVAIPHGKMKGIDTILCSYGRSRGGVDFDAVDAQPVHIFFLLLAPENAAGLHLQMLSRISRILRDPSFRRKLSESVERGEAYGNILEEDEKFSG